MAKRDKHPKSVGYLTGRRTARPATPKRDMAELIARLNALSLGSRQISKLTGYSTRRINEIQRDAGLPAVAKSIPRDALLSLLPADLRCDVERVYTKSCVAIERAYNRENECPARSAHFLVDDEDGECVNGDSGRDSLALKKREAA